jgi:hypothetical protein
MVSFLEMRIMPSIMTTMANRLANRMNRRVRDMVVLSTGVWDIRPIGPC